MTQAAPASPDVLSLKSYRRPPADLPVSAWFYDHFVDTYLGLCTYSTHQLYETALRMFLRLEGDLPLSAFAPPDGVAVLARFRDSLVRDCGIRPATAAKHLRHFRRILRKAGPANSVRDEDATGLLEHVAGVAAPKVKKRPPRTVSAEQWVRCYLAADVARSPVVEGLPAPDWWRGALVLSVALGPRSGTVVRIRREDVDLAGPEPRIRFRPGDKTDRDRWKALDPAILAHLVKLTAHGGKYLLPWPHRHRDGDSLVACNKPGCHSIRCARGDQMKRIQRAAGIRQRFTFHDLRRTAGTQEALEHGLRAAAELLDHTNVKTTRGYYVPEQIVAGEIGNLVAAALVHQAEAQRKPAEPLGQPAPPPEKPTPPPRRWFRRTADHLL